MIRGPTVHGSEIPYIHSRRDKHVINYPALVLLSQDASRGSYRIFLGKIVHVVFKHPYTPGIGCQVEVSAEYLRLVEPGEEADNFLRLANPLLRVQVVSS